MSIHGRWSGVAAVAGALLAAGAAAGGAETGPLFAAVGVSTKRDALQAAEAATKSMLAKFRARRRRPAAAIFLERTGRRLGSDGRAIGERVKQTAGVATYGAGGASGRGGVTWWAKRDFEPTFLVLGIAGAGVTVRPIFTAGAPAGGPADVQRRAEELGGQVPAPNGGGIGLFLGGLGGAQGGPFLSALRKATRGDVPLIGIAGRAGEYVYVDGRRLADPNGAEVHTAQLLLLIDGRLEVACGGAVSRNAADADAVLAEADRAADRVRQQLTGRTPGLVLAFSDPGRMRTSGLDAPGKELRRLRAALGADVPVFGCYAFCPVGVDDAGRFAVGPDRLVLAAVAEASAEEGDGKEAKP